jgi:nicotinate phosphoribosyltransferase
MLKDRLSVEDDRSLGTPLLRPVLRGGRRVEALPSLAEIRSCAAQSLRALPKPLSGLEQGFAYPVEVMPRLRELAEECDRRAAQGRA